MAVSINSVNGLFIRLNRALSLPVKYWPLVFTNIKKERVLGRGRRCRWMSGEAGEPCSVKNTTKSYHLE